MKSKGFTLLECLLSLMILGLSVLLINGIIRQMPQVNQQLFARKDQEYVVTIDRINGKVRKRDNNGYHPLLTEVSLIYFEKKASSIQFTVTFENGEVRIGQWQIPA